MVHDYLTSYDTEMLNYVAVVGPRLGAAIPYGLGRGTLGDLVIFPIKHFSLQLYSDQMLERLFVENGCASVCPVESEVGVLLFDFGLVGVALGMALTGYALRKIEQRLLVATSRRLWLVGL